MSKNLCTFALANVKKQGMKKLYFLFALLACTCSIQAQNKVINFFELLERRRESLRPDSLYINYELDTVTHTVTVTGFDPKENLKDASLGSEFLAEIFISDSINFDGINYPVTAIAPRVFNDCYNLIGVKLPNTITYVGSGAFSLCRNIHFPVYNDHVFAYLPSYYAGHYSVPDGIEYIAGYAFAESGLLTSISIPNSVQDVDVNAFSDCPRLSSEVYNDHFFAYLSPCYTGDYAIPEGIKTIGNGAFENARNMTSVTIPNSVTTIGKGAFVHCCIDTIVLPDSVRYIDAQTFMGCPYLKTIFFPRYLDSIGTEAFAYCDGLQYVTIQEGVQSISKEAFYGCGRLQSVTFPHTLKTIGKEAFAWCRMLETIRFQEGIEQIGEEAFEDCNKLKEIHWPASLISVGKNAFDYYNLEQFTIDPANPVYYIKDGMLCTRDHKLLCCLNSVKGDVTVPDGIERIEEGAFLGCDDITSITLPSTIRVLGENAIYKCDKLKKINLSDNLESIEEHGLSYCPMLESIHVPAGVKRIAEKAFVGNYKVTSITVDEANANFCAIDGVLYSKDTTVLVFCPEKKKGTLYIPKQVTQILPHALNISKSVTKIVVDEQNMAFCVYDDILYSKDLSRLIVCPRGKKGRIDLPLGKIKSIEDDAFRDCKYITYIWISSTRINIGDGAFTGCDRLIIHADKYFQYIPHKAISGGKEIIYH